MRLYAFELEFTIKGERYTRTMVASCDDNARRALPWTCKERYASALEAIRAAANAWRTGADFEGYVVLRKAAV